MTRGRRQFCRELAAGVAGCTLCCDELPAHALRPQPSRREVRVAGHRVKAIDIHAHCVIPKASALVTDVAPQPPALIVGPERIRHMDEYGIDVAVLSINPNWYSLERNLVERVIATQNDGLAELCAAYPGRLVALATVALQYPDVASAQLESAVRNLGMHGVAIRPSVKGEALAVPRFDPFWAKAEELQALVFIHPESIPELEPRLQGDGYLSNAIGFPLDTAIGLSHLIFEGTLDRFPRLRICASHGGGMLPAVIARMDRSCLAFPDRCSKKVRRKPSEYLRQLYFDSIVFAPEDLRHIAAQSGASQIMLGTDDPFPWTVNAVDHVLATPGFSDIERAAILGGTAARLLHIPENA